MSVISLSSEDEDECVVLDSDDEDCVFVPTQTHQVFIVESIQSSSCSPSDKILSNIADNLNEQNISHNCKDKIISPNEISLTQNSTEVSVLENNQITHLSVNFSDKERNLNKHSDSPDDIKLAKQPVEDIQQNHQPVDIFKETKESGSKKEGTCSTSQRDQIFGALQLTSVSSADGPLTNYDTLRTTSRSIENKSESALKVLAEKLAQVLSNNIRCDVLEEQLNKANTENNVSSLEKTILDVAKGRQENKVLNSNSTSDISKSRSKVKDTKRKKKIYQKTKYETHKFQPAVEMHQPQIQSNNNQLMQVLSEANAEINHVSTQATKLLERNTIVEPSLSKITNQPRCHLETAENSEEPRNSSCYNRILNVLHPPESATESSFLSNNNNSKTHPSDSDVELIDQTSVAIGHEIEKEGLKRQQKHKVVPKSRKIGSQSYNQHSLDKDESYGNILKFTFDRSVSVYSVSVVSPSEPQPIAENISGCQNNIGNLDDKHSSSGQKILKDLEVTRSLNNTPILPEDYSPVLENVESYLLPEVPATSDVRSATDDFRNSSIQFSNILNIKSNFLKYYNIVFYDKTDELCVEMGYLLLKTIEESKNLLNLMKTPLDEATRTKQSHSFIFRSDDLKNAVKTCQDSLNQSKRKFVDHFSQVYNQINHRHIIGTQHKVVLLTTWFMKMFLRITAKSPGLMDILHEIKTKALQILSEEIVRWPLICQTFIKDEHQFECDCLLVLEFIKDCLNDQNELNSESHTSLSQNGNAVKPPTVASTSTNDQGNGLPKELQKLTKAGNIEVSVITNKKNSTETKPTTAGICLTTSIPSVSNKQDNLLATQTELDLSNDFQSPKKSSIEPIQINDFPSSLKNGSCKGDFQKTQENDFSVDKSTKKCETTVPTSFDCKSINGTPSLFNSENNFKEVFKFKYKRKISKFTNEKLKKHKKPKIMQHISDTLQKQHYETHENVQHRRPSSLVFSDGRASKSMASSNVAKEMDNIPKTNLENHELSSTNGCNSKTVDFAFTNSVKNGKPKIQYQHGVCPEIFNNTSIQNNMTSVSIDVERQTQTNRFPQEDVKSSLQNQPNPKQIQGQYLKENVSNSEPINHTIPFSVDQELDRRKNQLYVGAQSQVPGNLEQSKESPFLSGQPESQHHPNHTIDPNMHGQQNIQYHQSCKPKLHNHNHTNSPSKYSQNQYYYSNQAYYKEISANQNQFTMPTTPNSFQDNSCATYSNAINSNRQQFSVQNGDGVEISSCPITVRAPVCDIMSNTGVTVNNYNFTNYPLHISPELITHYNHPTM